MVSTIGNELVVAGELKSDGNVEIDGQVEGRIDAKQVTPGTAISMSRPGSAEISQSRTNPPTK